MTSIIITYYIGLNILKSNLTLLLSQKMNDVEIIIVNDNPNSDLSIDMLSLTTDIPIKIVAMSRNGGYAAACNYGVKHAIGNILIFMDSDILVSEGWLNHLLKAYHVTEHCGAVSATILNLNQKKVVHWGLAMNKGIEVIKPFRDGFVPAYLQHGIYSFNMATSGCILIPKKIFIEVGGFDEAFYNGFCDLDLTYCITNHGYQCVYCSDAIVYHRGKISGTIRLAAEDDTRALFVRKWKDNLLDDGMKVLMTLYKSMITFKSKPEYILLNFSRSLFKQDYHSTLFKSLNATQKSYYEFQDQNSAIVTLEDFLPWSMCGLQVPMIYYGDSITSIENNKHWFMHRRGKGDILADKNGNLLLTDNLLV